MITSFYSEVFSPVQILASIVFFVDAYAPVYAFVTMFLSDNDGFIALGVLDNMERSGCSSTSAMDIPRSNKTVVAIPFSSTVIVFSVVC